MPRRDRQRREARRPSFRSPKPLILVVCEGEITEPQYIAGFKSECHNPRVELEVCGGVGVPKTLIEYAKSQKRARESRARRERDENLRYDEVWCVFDVDDHPNIPEARQMARDNEIEVAISNPSIELWLWLHFAEQPGAQERHKLEKMMNEHVPGYRKHVNFNHYRGKSEIAIRRARRLDEDAQADDDQGRNPTTSFWRLAESISKGTDE